MARKKIYRKDKKCYLDFVWLSASEHAHLCELLGAEALEAWIVELNGYIGAKPGGDPYESHYYAIQNWARKRAAGSVRSAELGVRSNDQGAATSAQRAADRVIELLKDPQASMPTADEKTRQALYTTLTERKLNWPKLRALLKENPEESLRYREDFLAAYVNGN